MKRYAVLVFDNTCNVSGKEFGAYADNDYSWMTESLNGGNAEYIIESEQEALEVMEKYIALAKSEGIEWASFGIDEIEIEDVEL